jgi:hypothetical protein
LPQIPQAQDKELGAFGGQITRWEEDRSRGDDSSMDLALSTPSPGAIGVALPLRLAASLVGSKSGAVAGYAFYRLSDPTDRPERHRRSGALKQ